MFQRFVFVEFLRPKLAPVPLLSPALVHLLLALSPRRAPVMLTEPIFDFPSLRLPLISRSFHVPLRFPMSGNLQVAGEKPAGVERSLHIFLAASLVD